MYNYFFLESSWDYGAERGSERAKVVSKHGVAHASKAAAASTPK